MKDTVEQILALIGANAAPPDYLIRRIEQYLTQKKIVLERTQYNNPNLSYEGYLIEVIKDFSNMGYFDKEEETPVEVIRYIDDPNSVPC